MGHDTITVVVMCTIAVAKVQPNYNCYNVYFNECLRLSRMEPSSFKDETFTLPRGKIKVSSFVGAITFISPQLHIPCFPGHCTDNHLENTTATMCILANAYFFYTLYLIIFGSTGFSVS